MYTHAHVHTHHTACASQARRVPELEESVRQLEASLCATEEELHHHQLHAVHAARHKA